ncbi:MAG: hypothetical protein K8F91_02675, partial [Candidatus Obscuribacterales bacterium]|nr:hypothetical protein [Candidatus Obscuribacterales bacterium]
MDGVFKVLSGIGIALLFFALIIGALVGIAWLGELRRRRLEDRLGFKEFVQAGARMKHPTMIEGFARQVPESLADMKIQFSVLNLGDFRVGSGQVYV